MTLNHPDGSTLVANQMGRDDVMVHNITFTRIIDPESFRYVHRAGYEFRLPYLPSMETQELAGQTVEGGLFVWDGPGTRLDYGTAFQWVINWTCEDFGTLYVWTTDEHGERWEPLDHLEVDTEWHAVEYSLDFDSGSAHIKIDDQVYETPLTRTVKIGWGDTVDARLQAEIISIYSGDSVPGARHETEFRNWYWEWIPQFP